jgi:hypothetical protein
MKFLLLLAILSFLTLTATAQTTERSNPVVFAESFFGGAKGKAGGLSGGGELSYQVRRSLFSARITGNVRFASKTVLLTPFTPFPVIEESSSSEELAALYGWRFTNQGHAFSVSLGVSHNRYTETYYGENDERHKSRATYLGLPFEANIKWFKAEKRPFRIYGLIPVGPPTGFGGSIGFKVFGNISRHSYCGIGLAYGLGFHRKY